MRRVCYVSGTRADFGLMERALKSAQREAKLEIAVCVTGMHLTKLFGETVREIEASGIRICARVPVALEAGTGAEMARATGTEIIGIVNALERERPDAVVVLGDRGEMLAGAYAAVHLNIPVVHIHGGERSGTVDEPVRHAISKLAHYHLVATNGSRERLVRMGENPERIFVTGAPGLDELGEGGNRTREELCGAHGFDASAPLALVVFHPVLQEAEDAGAQVIELVEGVLAAGCQCLWLAPNSDAGSAAVRTAMAGYASEFGTRLLSHLPRKDYISWMAAADVMAGNSSSGIIEAASLGLRVVNVGSRQRLRERSENVVDVPAARREIEGAVRRALREGRGKFHNVYGDGQAGARIANLLRTLVLDAELLNKTNAY